MRIRGLVASSSATRRSSDVRNPNSADRRAGTQAWGMEFQNKDASVRVYASFGDSVVPTSTSKKKLNA